MPANLQKLRNLPDGTIYADPNDPDYTVRFKTTSAPKSLNGLKTTNYICEIIVNDSNTVTIGSTDVVDPVSVRVRCSGALESHSRLAAILGNVAAKLSTWAGENVLIGFDPSTPPVDYSA